MPSAPGPLAGGPTQAAPGVRGEEEQWAREIGAQLRRMADDLNALYEWRVSLGPAEAAGGTGRQGGERRGVGLRAALPDVLQLLLLLLLLPGATGSCWGHAGVEGSGRSMAGMARARARARGGGYTGRQQAPPRWGPRPRGLRAALGAAAHISRAIYSR